MIALETLSLDGLEPSIGKKLSSLVSYCLASLHKQGYGVMVSVDLADLKSFRDEQPECEAAHTAFDIEYHPNEIAAQGLFLTRHGERVGTVWRRIIPLRDYRTLRPLTLKQCFEGLHIFYDDPGLSQRRETCEVDCEIADLIRGGSVCYCGAAWHHPQHRGLGLFKTMALLSLVLSITAPEQWDWFIATAEEKNRELAISLFPYVSYTRNMVHKGLDLWLCTASYKEAVGIAMRAAE